MSAGMIHAPAHELFEIALGKADEARDLGKANEAWRDKHEDICELRQGQLRADLASLQKTVRWATATLLTSMGTVILLLIFKGHLL